MRVCQFRHFGAGSERVRPKPAASATLTIVQVGLLMRNAANMLAGCGSIVLGVAEHTLLAVLLQLVMQGLQADAEYFGGACLVVVRGLESFKDQQPFSFIDGGSDTKMDGICVVHGSARDGFSKSWRKMLGLDGGA